MVHVGADMFLRKCYNPEDWHHDFFVIDKNGLPKNNEKLCKYHIAGPLCFGGDIIGRDILLPEVSEGDYLIIEDVGSYTTSMWSRYNSRQLPKILGYYENSDNFEVIKERESLESVLSFWK